MDKLINVKTIPSFILRIDSSEILKNYLQGKYKTLVQTKTDTSKIKVVNIDFVTIDKNTDSVDNPIFIFNDKNSNSHTIVFSNHEEYDAYVHNKKLTRRCQLCFREFDHPPERIPLSIEDRYLDNPETNTKIRTKIIWSTGVYCHPNHCYTGICMITSRNRKFNNYIYNNSEFIYRNICNLRFPNLELKEVDITLLKRFGGSLDQEEFDDPKFTYKHIENFYIVPVKISHEKIRTTN